MKDTPTDFSEYFELLQKCSQQLWRETKIDSFVAKFAEVSRDHFGIVQCSLYNLVQTPATEQTSAKVVAKLSDFTPSAVVPSLSSEIEQDLMQQLQALNLKSPEFRQGANTLQVGAQQLGFALIGDPAADWMMIVWQAQTEISDPMQEQLRQRAVDFLVRQMQSEAIWFNRLDKTQALLYRDDLTGLFNGRYLDIAIDTEIRRSQRFQSVFCLLFIDLDNFKPVNDQHGHLSGSMVLKQVADVLRAALREVDSSIRYGGDEFVVLLLGANANTGLLAAERIRRRIEKTEFRVEDQTTVRVTASIGVAAFPDHGKTRDSLLKLADQTMYEGKRLGKNRVMIVGGREKSALFAGDGDEKL